MALLHRATLLSLVLLAAATVVAIGSDEAFRAADRDKNGCVDRTEFRALAARLQMAVTGLVGDGTAGAAAEAGTEAAAGGISTGPGFWGGFVSGVGMIIATEIGDKTFFIAAIMAMQYSRVLVFGGAISALAVMTVLSAALGFALPNVLPREYTHYAGALLFSYFGVTMLRQGFKADGGGPSEELAEVEQELMQSKRTDEGDLEQDSTHAHSNGHSRSSPKGVSSSSSSADQKKDAAAVFTQGFTLTFLAEWGDRSQIATIALAAAKNVYGVTLGGILGHSLCTGLAVVGGRLLAARISERTVHLTGGALFLVFGLHSLIFGL